MTLNLDNTGGYWEVRPNGASLGNLVAYTMLVHNPVPDRKLHVTLAYDKRNPHNPVEVDSSKLFTGNVIGAELLGPDNKILALVLDSPSLQKEHERIHASGEAQYDYTPYLPHVTLSYDSNELELKWVLYLIETQEGGSTELAFSNQTRKPVEE